VHRYVGATVPLSFILALALLARPAQAGFHKEGEVAAFLSKKAPCYAWAFGVHKIGSDPDYDGIVTRSLFCVFDGSLGAGGINEKRGCFASLYNVETDQIYTSLYQGRVPLPMVQEKCSEEAVKKLLDKYVAQEALKGAPGTWSDKLKKSVFGGPGADALREIACKEIQDSFRDQLRDLRPEGETWAVLQARDPLQAEGRRERMREVKKLFNTQQKLFCTPPDGAKKN